MFGLCSSHVETQRYLFIEGTFRYVIMSNDMEMLGARALGILLKCLFLREYQKKQQEDFSVEKLNVAIADDNERMLQTLGDIVKSDDELQGKKRMK